MRKSFSCLLALCLCVPAFLFSACKEKEAQIEIPQNISLTEEEKEPVIKMYDINDETIKEMGLEEYVMGVLAGEIFNTWPKEALKAQAILARTYTLYFLQNLTTKYEGANISNDINEAQAYDEDKINENIINAVNETRGIVILSNGQPIEAWFHSNSGGCTTTAKNGLSYLGEENYTQVTSSPETDANTENFKWSYTFSKSDLLTALREIGIGISTVSGLKVGQKDDSGRAISLVMGNAEFSANTLRQKLGSTKMKSTLISDIVVSSNSISISGYGYGHGVGMSQWGAKVLAEQGKTAEEIVKFYFQNIEVKKVNYS